MRNHTSESAVLRDVLTAISVVSLTNGFQFSVSILGLFFALSNGSSIKAENINFKHTRILKISLNFISIFNAVFYTIFGTFHPSSQSCFYLGLFAEITHHLLFMIINYILLFRMCKIVCDPFSTVLKIQTRICWSIMLLRAVLTVYSLFQYRTTTNPTTQLCSFYVPEYLIQTYCYLDIVIDLYATGSIVYKLYKYSKKKEENRAMRNVLVTNILRCFIVTILNILPLILDAILNYSKPWSYFMIYGLFFTIQVYFLTYERALVKLLTKASDICTETKTWNQKKVDENRDFVSKYVGENTSVDASNFQKSFSNKQSSKNDTSIQVFIDPANKYEPEWDINSAELAEIQSEKEADENSSYNGNLH
ncbi:hypothetical protein HK099_003855 [Clydaea vesicula]|uniref:Uncharacterized protein n=1 Tax=Clydaea vesicula TaxID=447962 RepID=A0AAD5U3X7_9FUNG|nr:hypothetical protein HK099_003855 [Clydaea vesicula]